MWRAIRAVRFPCSRGSPGAAIAFQRMAYARSQTLVRCVYLFYLYKILVTIRASEAMLLGATGHSFLWPLAWAQSPHVVAIIVPVILVGVVVTGIVALVLLERRWARLAFACLGFFFIALINSFGKINHGFHIFLLSSLLFVALPEKADSISRRHAWLSIVWTAMALFLLTYTMSGLDKVWGIIEQLGRGEQSALHPDAMALQAAARILQNDTGGILSELAIARPGLGAPLYYLALYIEIFAVIIAWRPALHRLWGLGLIGFHVSVWLFMNVVFFEHIVLAFLFLVWSPFAPTRSSLSEAFVQLPLVGDVIRLGRRLMAKRRQVRALG